VWVFGSYARGALEVGDVDLAVEFDQTADERGLWFATRLAGGFDHEGALRREVRGNQRVLELHLNELDALRKEGFEPQLLWMRGDSFETARDRLGALAPDASAERASRDTVHPLLVEVEKLVPRPARQEFSVIYVGWLARREARRPTRPGGDESDHPPPLPAALVEYESALPRGTCVASYLEHDGIAPLGAVGTLYSDQREVIDAERDYWRPSVAVHFGGKLLQWAMFDFGQGTPRVLVVLNPTSRKQPLRALDMRALVGRDEFFNFQHGDGQPKLIKRLAAADRAGELPDYMREFVDSLRLSAFR
jgi:hypothetical protein